MKDSHTKFILIITVCIFLLTSQAYAFSVGGFSLGDSDDEGAGLDLTNIVDAVNNTKQAFSDISPEEERAIGRQSASIVLGVTPIVYNAALHEYVNKIGLWVAKHSEQPELSWRFAVLDSDSINAYATPGGFIFITRGLLFRLKNEAQLAAVLAHEIVHVLQQHHVKALKKNARAGLAGNLATLAGGPKYQVASELMLSGIKELYARGLDRDDELEADHMGVVLMARAGYDPYELMAVLLILDSVNPEDSSIEQFLNTHPAPLKRMQHLDGLMRGKMDQYATQTRGEDRFIRTLTRAFTQDR